MALREGISDPGALARAPRAEDEERALRRGEEARAVEVLAGRFGEGDTIVVEPDGETLRFRKEAPAAVAS